MYLDPGRLVASSMCFGFFIYYSHVIYGLKLYGQWVSRYEADLVAKCYFAKHKLVWEVLDGGLKSKIEM